MKPSEMARDTLVSYETRWGPAGSDCPCVLEEALAFGERRQLLCVIPRARGERTIASYRKGKWRGGEGSRLCRPLSEPRREERPLVGHRRAGGLPFPMASNPSSGTCVGGRVWLSPLCR